jgi:hypothetical protein
VAFSVNMYLGGSVHHRRRRRHHHHHHPLLHLCRQYRPLLSNSLSLS